MKVLIDTCLGCGLKIALQKDGYDVVWSGEWPKDPGDEEILKIANQEQRILITLDKDYGELAVFHNQNHSGILRLVNLSLKQQVLVALNVLKIHGDLLQKGALITAEPGRLRIRTKD